MLKPISKTLEIALSNGRKSIAIYEARCAAMPVHNPSTTSRTAGQLLASMTSRHPEGP
jgi:phage baseplate assembly protein W